jgi:hypothetical protein
MLDAPRNNAHCTIPDDPNKVPIDLSLWLPNGPDSYRVAVAPIFRVRPRNRPSSQWRKSAGSGEIRIDTSGRHRSGRRNHALTPAGQALAAVADLHLNRLNAVYKRVFVPPCCERRRLLSLKRPCSCFVLCKGQHKWQSIPKRYVRY